MLIVGLAGGIATGKSLIVQEAAKLPGVTVIDADKIAWETYKKNTPVYAQLVERFGKKILASDGEIDRKQLGQIVFSDEEARQFLNRVVHPAVGARVQEIAEQHRAQGTKLLLIEAALLLESAYAVRDVYDYIVLVKVSPEEQIQRLMERNNLSPQEASQKVHARLSLEEQIAQADFVLDTSGTPEETRARARELFGQLLSRVEL
ncbi:dephospho-CoA kinase [Candidatus Acetothermia bacterium]|nr:dephospho-CoA kinase [Candidatus Acetothermia bacterium]